MYSLKIFSSKCTFKHGINEIKCYMRRYALGNARSDKKKNPTHCFNTAKYSKKVFPC